MNEKSGDKRQKALNENVRTAEEFGKALAKLKKSGVEPIIDSSQIKNDRLASTKPADPNSNDMKKGYGL